METVRKVIGRYRGNSTQSDIDGNVKKDDNHRDLGGILIWNKPRELTQPILHYYGDIVRRLFLISAVIMLILLPFLYVYIPISRYEALLVVLLLIILSGITNPRLLITSIFDMIVSFIGVFVFGKYALDSYMYYSVYNIYFWVNHVLSVIFLVTLYFSIKTVRGMIVDKQ